MQTQRGMMFVLIGFIGLLMLYLMSQQPSSGINRPAPDGPLALVPNSPPVRISSLRGKVVLLDLWATWCGPCRQSMPELEKIYQKYKAKGVLVVGISVDEERTQPQIPAVKQALGITYPTVIGMNTPELLNSYQSPGLPTLYVIDKQGNIRKNDQGFNPVDGMKQVDELVGELVNE